LCNGVEYGGPINAPVLPGVIALAAARYKVCRRCLAAVLARDQMVELRALDRHNDAAIRTREAVTM